MHADDHRSNPTHAVEIAAPGVTRRASRRRGDDLHRFAGLLPLIPDATLVVDSTGHIQVVNHQLEELFGYSAKELLGQPVEMLIAEHLRAVQRRRLAASASDDLLAAVAGIPWSGRRRDGSEFPAEVHLGPLSADGDEGLFMVSIHDISDLQWVHDAQVTTQAANQELQALQAITDTAFSHLALDDLLAALLERITAILHVDNSTVLLVDSAGEMLTVQAVHGLLEPVAPEVRMPVGEGFAGRIAATGEPVVVDDITTFPVFNSSFREQFHSLAGVPLVLGDRVIGVVHIGTVQPRHFTDADVHLLQQVADRMALAIDRARLYQAEQQARAEAQQQAAQLAATFEAMADGVVVFDTEGRLLRENSAQRRLLGIDSAPHVDGLPLQERLALFAARDVSGRPLGLDEGPLPRALRGELVSGVETMDLLSHTLDGREVALNVSAAPLRDEEGHVTGAVAVFRDQTAQMRLAREREEAHARELAAEGVAQQMSAFLATAAHDIRSPLTVAVARVQLAVKASERLVAALNASQPALSVTAEPPKRLAAEVRESLQRAYAGIDRLKRLVNLLFDVTQAQSQQLVLELAAVDLRAMVEEQVAAEQHASTYGHRLHLQLPTHPVWVEADADRLDEVLANFISNALKYSPSAVPVTVGVSVEDQVAVVRVTDQGPGISPEEQSHIWDPFYRSPDVPIQPGNLSIKGSLGLGLSICKQLIELHPGGRLGVESSVGKGATFWFRLPLSSHSSRQ